MAKVLCIIGIVVSVLLLILFLTDLILALTPAWQWGPFGGKSIMTDILFVLCAAGLGAISFFTLREQV